MEPSAENRGQQGGPEKNRKELPLVSVPDDRELLAQEMAELFEEDKVTHQHGSSEPEAD
ncbi:hypothetical protein [Candidatus Nitrospira bockiana]